MTVRHKIVQTTEQRRFGSQQQRHSDSLCNSQCGTCTLLWPNFSSDLTDFDTEGSANFFMNYFIIIFICLLFCLKRFIKAICETFMTTLCNPEKVQRNKLFFTIVTMVKALVADGLACIPGLSTAMRRWERVEKPAKT